MVVQGSISHPTDSSDQLLDLFDTGSKNRHVSSTSKIPVNHTVEALL